MPVNRHNRPRLQGIQHSLRQVVWTISKIHTLAQARVVLSLLRQLIKYIFRNNHIRDARLCRLARPRIRIIRVLPYINTVGKDTKNTNSLQIIPRKN